MAYDYYNLDDCDYGFFTCYELYEDMYSVQDGRLCTFGFFCSSDVFIDCPSNETTIKECSACSGSSIIALATTYSLVAFFGILLNVLVIASVLVKKRSKSSFDYVKMSLAVADMLWGITIFAFTVPNMAMTLNLTPQGLQVYTMLNKNGLKLYIGFALTVSCQIISTYHIVFFSIQRFIAIVRPDWFRKWGKLFTVIGLLLVWLISGSYVLVESIWSPKGISHEITYASSTFSYGTYSNQKFFLMWIGLYYIIPFTTMTVMTISTGVVIRMKMGNLSSRSLKKQKSIFITLSLMEVALFIAIVPLMALNFVFFYVKTNCFAKSLAILIFTNMAATNSIVDPLIYTVKDSEFKKNCRMIYNKVFCKADTHTPTTSSTAISTPN